METHNTKGQTSASQCDFKTKMEDIIDVKFQNLNLQSQHKETVIEQNNKMANIENTHIFDINNYFELIENSIKNILSRPENDTLTFDILDTEKSKQNKLIALKERQRQMKIGEIWQEVLGNYDGFINLKIGHESGLDIVSHTKKIAIELKNRTNTDNASSKKSNLEKLAKYKIQHPDYICIYANINAYTESKTYNSNIKKILVDISDFKCEIEHHIGYEFLKFILCDDTNKVIEFVKNTIDKYT